MATRRACSDSLAEIIIITIFFFPLRIRSRMWNGSADFPAFPGSQLRRRSFSKQPKLGYRLCIDPTSAPNLKPIPMNLDLSVSSEILHTFLCRAFACRPKIVPASLNVCIHLQISGRAGERGRRASPRDNLYYVKTPYVRSCMQRMQERSIGKLSISALPATSYAS